MTKPEAWLHLAEIWKAASERNTVEMVQVIVGDNHLAMGLCMSARALYEDHQIGDDVYDRMLADVDNLAREMGINSAKSLLWFTDQGGAQARYKACLYFAQLQEF